MEAAAGSPDAPPRFRWGRGLWTFAIACLAAPLLVFPTHRYVTYGFYDSMGAAAVHAWGYWLASALLFGAFVALLLGFMHPRIVLWFGPASRRRAAWSCASVACIAGLLWAETHALGLATYALEARALEAVFEQLQPGDTLRQVDDLTRTRVFGARLRLSGKERPEIQGQALPPGHYVLLQIAPGLARNDRMVIATTPPRDQGGSTDAEFFSRRVVKAWLVLDDRLSATR